MGCTCKQNFTKQKQKGKARSDVIVGWFRQNLHNVNDPRRLARLSF